MTARVRRAQWLRVVVEHFTAPAPARADLADHLVAIADGDAYFVGLADAARVDPSHAGHARLAARTVN